jgi:enolase
MVRCKTLSLVKGGTTMVEIKRVVVKEIPGSRCNPTVQVDVTLTSSGHGQTAVPSEASTGEREVIEPQHRDKKRKPRKGIIQAIRTVYSLLVRVMNFIVG